METKNQELSRAVEELGKVVKDTGEGSTSSFVLFCLFFFQSSCKDVLDLLIISVASPCIGC